MRDENKIMSNDTRNEIKMQIDATKEQINATKELVAIKVNAIETSTKESIKAFEARIDSMLMKFIVQNKQIDNEKK